MRDVRIEQFKETWSGRMGETFSLPSPNQLLMDRVKPHLPASIGETERLLAVFDVIKEDIIPYMRVGIRSRHAWSGHYLTATETDNPRCRGAFYAASSPTEKAYAVQVIEDRRELEVRHDLRLLGRTPASGCVVLVSPPEVRGIVGWVGDNGDNTNLYGPILRVLHPHVLARSIFVLGDSFNLMAEQYDRQLPVFDQALMDVSRAGVYTASMGLGPLPARLSVNEEVDYIEAMVLGGVVERDVERTIRLDDPKVVPPAQQRFFHDGSPICYGTYRVLRRLGLL